MELVPGDPVYGYDDGTELSRYVQLFDLPGTPSGGILCLERNLAPVQGHLEIEGDLIRSLDEYPTPSQPVENDSEDIGDLLTPFEVDPAHQG